MEIISQCNSLKNNLEESYKNISEKEKSFSDSNVGEFKNKFDEANSYSDIRKNESLEYLQKIADFAQETLDKNYKLDKEIAEKMTT